MPNRSSRVFALLTPLTAPIGVAPVGAASAHDLDGAWDGTLRAGADKLRCVIHLRTTSAGLRASMDSVDQGAAGIPVSSVVRDGETLRLELTAIGAAYEGRLTDARTIEGTWRQAGNALPLVLTRRVAGAAGPALNRPQTPVKPYSYRTQEVAFASTSGVRIAGTLTLPQGAGPFPAAILIAGSGPIDRNGTAFGHHVLWVLADHLTRRGLAVLRFDKRGVGDSTGDYARATSEDFAADVAAGLAYLRGRDDVGRIGLVGHSEGAMIAPIVAGRETVAFVVLMAPPGVRGQALLVSQARALQQQAGVPDATIATNAAELRRLYDAVARAPDAAAAAAAAHAILAESGAPADAQRDARVKAVTDPWMRFFLAHDPLPALRALTAPVLAILGEKDIQVAPAESLPPIRAALAAHPDAELCEIAGTNHLFQTARTGTVAEYAQIEETISPAVLDMVAGWIMKRMTP